MTEHDRRPSRINVEADVTDDPGFHALVAKLGHFGAMGMLVFFWKLAQRHWKRGEGIPEASFKLGGFEPLLDTGFAVRCDDGIRARGDGEQFSWLKQKQTAGQKGGRKKAKNLADAKRELAGAKRSLPSYSFSEGEGEESAAPSAPLSPPPPQKEFQISSVLTETDQSALDPGVTANIPANAQPEPERIVSPPLADSPGPAVASPADVAVVGRDETPDLTADDYPFGDQTLVKFFEDNGIDAPQVWRWVSWHFGGDAIACEAQIKRVVSRLMSNKTKLGGMAKGAIATYLNGALDSEGHKFASRPIYEQPAMQLPGGAAVISLSGTKAETPDAAIARGAREQAEANARRDAKYGKELTIEERREILARVRQSKASEA